MRLETKLESLLPEASSHDRATGPKPKGGSVNKAEALKVYWADVRAGRRPKPVRKPHPEKRITVAATLDGSFGPDRDKRIILTVHPDGRLELRPERTRRAETIHIIDAYRFALRCRVNRSVLEKARATKERKAIRLAQQRQARAEKRLLR